MRVPFAKVPVVVYVANFTIETMNSTMRRFTAPGMNIFTFERFPISRFQRAPRDGLLCDIR